MQSDSSPKSRGPWPVYILAGVLVLLFWRSFLPGYVHFSNDGPLGAQMANWIQVPAAFTGAWEDLNDIGLNAGSFPLDVNALFRWSLGAVGYAKFWPVVALFLLGLGAWTFFRQLKLTPVAAVLGALAAMLNSAFFSNACWGVASQQVGIAMDFFALALIMGMDGTTPMMLRWARWMLAGFCVGINIMEAADIGAIFSIFIAIYVFIKSLADGEGSLVLKGARGVGRVAVVAIFAAIIAIASICALISTQIQGLAGGGDDATSKAEHWDWTTQWSLPKMETVGLVVPGLFGYKMDTPNNMPEIWQGFYMGGQYWGGMGRSPEIDRYLDSGSEAPMPGGPNASMRFAGGQNYAGITVALIAAWAIAQSLRRKQDTTFNPSQQKYIWFWALVLLGSLVLSWGRFDPFHLYQLTVYKLPYFSSIRNPTKFLLVFSWAASILFAYGVHDLSRRFLNPNTPATTFSAWWARVSGFDRKWTYVTGGLVVASVLGWLVYSSEKDSLVGYLHKVGFNDDTTAGQVADYSIFQAGVFAVFFAILVGLVTMIIAGVFSGAKARRGAILLGALLVFDLGHADLPYVSYWDYVQKYEVGTLNPIVASLSQKPYEHRVMLLPFPPAQGMELFDDVYRIEWIQQLFPYYNIQSLDIVQRPRVGSDIAAFEQAMMSTGRPDTLYLFARHWQLTNTRYFVGPMGTSLPNGPVDTLAFLNGAFDPLQHRFQLVQRFNVVPKPGVAQPRQLSELTVQNDDNGKYALFEFTGALPRVKLYTNWQVITNDEANLQTLASTNFDPATQVLVSSALPTAPTGGTNAGTVSFTSYDPKRILLSAQAAAPSVLLLNDKFDAQWTVTVDGKPAQVLRCNYIMRGVYLPAGQHTVEFYFGVPNQPLYITGVAIVAAFGLCGFVLVAGRRQRD